MAWAADRPSFVFGDVRIPIRLLAVMVEEDGEHKFVNAHFSVGVPDEMTFMSQLGLMPSPATA